jgi:hypothetical protein
MKIQKQDSQWPFTVFQTIMMMVAGVITLALVNELGLAYGLPIGLAISLILGLIVKQLGERQ